MDIETVLDEELGVFSYKGTPLIRVSEVLVKGGLIDPRFFTREGTVRGTAVHDAVFLHLFNDLHFESLHPIVKPFIDCYLMFEEITKFRPLLNLCEKRQIHPFYFYTGRPDLVGFLNGRPAIIDIKTGCAKAARYQTAAYSEFPAFKELFKDKFIDRYDLQLNPVGKLPKLSPHKDPNDWLIFLSALVRARE